MDLILHIIVKSDTSRKHSCQLNAPRPEKVLFRGARPPTPLQNEQLLMASSTRAEGVSLSDAVYDGRVNRRKAERGRRPGREQPPLLRAE